MRELCCCCRARSNNARLKREKGRKRRKRDNKHVHFEVFVHPPASSSARVPQLSNVSLRQYSLLTEEESRVEGEEVGRRDRKVGAGRSGERGSENREVVRRVGGRLRRREETIGEGRGKVVRGLRRGRGGVEGGDDVISGLMVDGG
jgi:hypothetical protein